MSQGKKKTERKHRRHRKCLGQKVGFDSLHCVTTNNDSPIERRRNRGGDVGKTNGTSSMEIQRESKNPVYLREWMTIG